MLTFDRASSPYGRAYRAIVDSVETVITLIGGDSADDRARLTGAVSRHRKLRALGRALQEKQADGG